MKREIKFRGKRIDNGDWVEGFYIQIMSFGNEYHCIFEAPNIDSFNDLNDYKVIPETVGQFTGLKDRYGSEIYEGDIIKTKQGIATVIWSDAAFALYSEGSEAIDWEHSSVYELSEVIGNIHDLKMV